MSQLMKAGFDPSYGLFRTTSEQLFYPNPDAALAQPDCLKHFGFLGRMLGKIIYESNTIDLPLADFFLCKLLNESNTPVGIYHLESLDPELYKYETFDISLLRLLGIYEVLISTPCSEIDGRKLLIIYSR